MGIGSGSVNEATWPRKLPRPIGVLAANDSYAWLVSTACRLAGLAVPADVAILGVDNDEVFCSLTRPPLVAGILLGLLWPILKPFLVWIVQAVWLTCRFLVAIVSALRGANPVDF